jgi:hypothetical protein
MCGETCGSGGANGRHGLLEWAGGAGAVVRESDDGHRVADPQSRDLDDVVRELRERADDFGAAAGQGVGVTVAHETHDADASRAGTAASRRASLTKTTASAATPRLAVASASWSGLECPSRHPSIEANRSSRPCRTHNSRTSSTRVLLHRTTGMPARASRSSAGATSSNTPHSLIQRDWADANFSVIRASCGRPGPIGHDDDLVRSDRHLPQPAQQRGREHVVGQVHDTGRWAALRRLAGPGDGRRPIGEPSISGDHGPRSVG